jgi:hypothetical protein
MNFNELFQKMRELDAPVAEELKGGQKKLDVDKDGDIEADDLADLRAKKVDEEIVDECGMDMPMPMSSPKQQDNVTMNISMNGSGAGGIRDLMDILRDIENGPQDSGDGMDDEMGIIIDKMAGDEEGHEVPLIGMDEAEAGGFDQASTTPDETYQDTEYMTKDLAGGINGPKDMYKHSYRQGDNPMAMTMEALTNRLSNLYQEVKSR